MSDRRRYIVGVTKVAHGDRDVVRDALGATGEERGFLDVLGADTPDDDDRFPVGADCAYAVDLTEDEAARLIEQGEGTGEHNVRYIQLDEDATLDVATEIPRQYTRWWMGHTFAPVGAWHGRDVPVAVVDQGTSPAARSYMAWSLAARRVFNTANPPPAGSVYTGAYHGCYCAGLAVPYGGTLVDVHVGEPSGNFTAATAAAGIVWAVDQAARVVSCSFGFAGDTASHPVFSDAFGHAAAAGAVVFCSAGNTSDDEWRSPGAFVRTHPGVHRVMSFDTDTGTLAPTSTWSTDARVGVAPGSGILTVAHDGTEILFSGTSAACPNAAQQCARIMTGGRYTAREAAAALRASFRDTRQPIQGGGAYDLRRALVHLGELPPLVTPAQAGGAA